MRIIITGTTGLLGEAFQRILTEQGHEVLCPKRQEMDLDNEGSIQDYLLSESFDVLINPAGMTSIEQCYDALPWALKNNTYAPGMMAQLCEQKGAKFVHFSTDYVFSGKTPGLQTEEVEPEPVNMYGMTKRKGEIRVLENPNAIVCRVAWLFGQNRGSVLDRVVHEILNGDSLEYIQDKWSIPTWVDSIVPVVMELIEREQTGLFHVCSNNDPVSWWEYAKVVSELTCEALGREPVEVGKVDLDSIKAFRDVRPKHTAMACTRLKELGIELPRWEQDAKKFVHILLEKKGLL